MNNYTNVDTTTLVDLIIDRTSCMIDEATEMETMVKELCFRDPLKENFTKYADFIHYLRTSKNWLQAIGNHMLQDKAALKLMIAAQKLGTPPEMILEEKVNIQNNEDFPTKIEFEKIDVGTILIANHTFGSGHMIDFKKGNEYKIKSIVSPYVRIISENGSIEDIELMRIGGTEEFSFSVKQNTNKQ